MYTVAVLMSTYNGQKFLREQLNTILEQKGVALQLFVRDDGSSDETKSILTEYAERYENIHLDFAENVGVGNSFMNLLYSAPSTFDFYAFSDQDDLWEENKLIEAIELLLKSGKLLYASNQECVDKNGVSLGLRYGENDKIHLTPVSILSRNTIAGCTMVITDKLYGVLSDKDKRPNAELLRNRIHDVWLAMVASLYDGIIYDSRSFIKYRQHENNVVGAYSAGAGKRLKAKFKKVFHSKDRNGRSKLAKEICRKFPEVTGEHPLVVLCAKKSLKSKFGLLKRQKELRSYTNESRFGFFVKVMLGLF